MGTRVRLRQRRPLVRAAVELVHALNAFRPLGRKGYATFLAFWFGWRTTEVPHLFMTASMIDAVRRARRGDFTGRRGQAALALTAASWAILAAIYRRGVASRPEWLDALGEEIGIDYTDLLATLPVTPSQRRPSAVHTTLMRRRYVEKDSVVRYGPYSRANLADVWRRVDLPRDGKAPVVVQVPGGGWVIGWRRPQAYPLMGHLADRGWICVSLNYRVSPLHTWPDHIIDVKRALAWVKENIASFGGDPDFVAITGGSAGGHLAALAALTPDDPRFQPGFEDSDTSVVAAISMYGRYDWVSTHGDGRREFIAFLEKFVVKKPFRQHQDIYVDASPIRRVRPDAPPFFVAHGRDDSIIPVGEAREFVAALRAVSKSPVVYAELRNAQHGFDFMGSARAHYAADAVARFLSSVYATKR